MNVSIQLDLAKYFVDNSSVGGKYPIYKADFKLHQISQGMTVVLG